ncbi:MAG: DNA polymerase III subunit gamma/tau, partial [Treponema sp.]|nr:DNA polymerase III subunit gamma/tau [Treponema sp.]
VTATRRRPKTFDELAGQEFVVSTLKNSLRNSRIAHAYLFSGPRGCGKTSAARILARSLNCREGLEKGPCGTCDNCLAIKAGSSLAVIEIDGASNTSVNDVRQIKDEVLFPPQAGAYKIYIIDEVHMLSNSAFNALLKTIEEPPPYIIFIFATTELHKVPATIKSRCQQFGFRLIPLETIQGILRNVATELGIQAEDAALFWIAKESTGSMRDAFTLFDQVASFSGGHIREALIREKLGLAGLEKINLIAEACAEGDTARAFTLLDETLEGGAAMEQLIVDLAGYYRSLLLIKNGITRESVLGYAEGEFSATVLGLLDSPKLRQALEVLLQCYRDIRYSVSPRFELETAVAKLAGLANWVSPEELGRALKAAEEVLRGMPGGRGQGGLAGPFPAGEAGSPETESRSGNDEGPIPARSEEPVRAEEPAADFERSPFDEMRRALSGGKVRQNVPARNRADDAEHESDADDDRPIWSGMIGKQAGTEAAKVEPGKPETEETLVQRVLRMIPGEVIG